MPLYDYRCTACEQIFERKLPMSDYELPTTDPCPSCLKPNVIEQFLGATPFIDSVRLGITKPDRTFARDVLGRMQSHIPRNKIGQGKFSIPGRA